MDILNLPTLQLLDQSVETDTAFELYAEMKEHPKCCQKCGVIKKNRSRYGSKMQTFADSPIRGKPVHLHINRQRYICYECGATFWEELPAINDKHQATRRLVEYIRRESFKRTFTSIAEEVNLAESTIRNIFRDYVKLLDGEYRRVIPPWIGLDELHIIGKPRFIFTNIKDRKLIEMLPNRNKPTIEKFFMDLQGKREVEYITMDMWNPYRDVCRYFMPNAKIIVDKFHIVRMANQSLDTIRKSFKSTLTASERKSLKNDRFLLLKRRHELSDAQQAIINSWNDRFPLLYNAYAAKEFYFDIWDSSDRQEAVERYHEWLSLIDDELKSAYQPLVTAMTNWHDEIFNYFEKPLTNAYTESLNGLIRVVNRVGRGYSFEVLRAKMLFSECMKYEPKIVSDEEGRPTPLLFCSTSPLPKYYGADISTLTQLLEDGLI